MPVQPPLRRSCAYTNKVTHRTSSIHYFPRKKKKGRISKFLKKLNPYNWFNEFLDIEITLEEFDLTPKKQ